MEINPGVTKRFIYAAERGNVGGVTNMLDAGVPVDSNDEHGWTALLLAALRNHTDVVHLLLQKGADVNKQDFGGWAALHVAAAWNSAHVIRVLLHHGASTNIMTNEGDIPLDLARVKTIKKLYFCWNSINSESEICCVLYCA